MITLSSPIGNLKITIHDDILTNIHFLSDQSITKNLPNELAKQMQHELTCYFQNPHHVFQIKHEIKGTAFQKKVWQALCCIPVGQTATYKELAIKLQTSPRAIGNACRANPLPLIIPCHRVVAKTGLGGFAGDRSGKLIEIKKWLLRYESNSHGNTK